MSDAKRIRLPWTEEECDYLRTAYRTSTPKQIAEHLGRSVRSVVGKRYLIAAQPTFEHWTDVEVKVLRDWYRERDGSHLMLDELAKKLGRLKSNICRKARKLGLTKASRPTGQRDRRRYKTPEALAEAMAWHRKRMWKVRPHPRGMAGKKHTAETKAKISKTWRAMWKSASKKQRQEWTRKQAEGARANNKRPSSRGSWKAGWREIGGKRHFFRSRWEANFARWVEAMGFEWEYEPGYIRFPEGETYVPDFRVTAFGETEYIEVKGWKDARSRKKIRLFRKHFPDVPFVVIDKDEYREMEDDARENIDKFPDWEWAKSPRTKPTHD